MTEHTKSFLPIVWSYVKQYNLTEDLFVKKKLKEGLKDTLKKMTDQKVAMVSEAVMIACNKISVDPFELLWTDRNVLGKDENGSHIWGKTKITYINNPKKVTQKIMSLCLADR